MGVFHISIKTETVQESCTELLSVDFVYCSSTDNALSNRSTAT